MLSDAAPLAHDAVLCMAKLRVFHCRSSQDSGIIFTLLPFGFPFSLQLFPQAGGDFAFLLATWCLLAVCWWQLCQSPQWLSNWILGLKVSDKHNFWRNRCMIHS